MNTKAVSLILFIVVVLTLINLTSLAYAQDPTTEPTTAPTIEPTAEPAPIPPDEPPPPTDTQDPVDIVVGIIAAVGALVANFIITLIKSIPYLSDPDKDKLATAVTEVVSVVVGLITGYILALAAQALGVIDDASIKAMAIAALTPVLAEVRYRVVKLAPQ